ncbi:MAG: hypothetical protein ACRC3Y_04280 [Romboutsia sp.]|uniref:hypothetical protein n=1 Tax=Romboutsia sp. TaxID=1965302 RepID=UPI003F3843AC
MSKYYNKSVIGIDVASEFSVATILPPNGEFSNKTLYDYYHKLIETKKKKVALVAIIHKIIKYIGKIFIVSVRKMAYLLCPFFIINIFYKILDSS